MLLADVLSRLPSKTIAKEIELDLRQHSPKAVSGESVRGPLDTQHSPHYAVRWYKDSWRVKDMFLGSLEYTGMTGMNYTLIAL